MSGSSVPSKLPKSLLPWNDILPASHSIKSSMKIHTTLKHRKRMVWQKTTSVIMFMSWFKLTGRFRTTTILIRAITWTIPIAKTSLIDISPMNSKEGMGRVVMA
jgi:hypothetical protein